MSALTWSPRARQDLLAIAEWYHAIDPALVDDMLQRIETAPTILLEFPALGAAAVDGARRWRVPGTPYLLFYDVVKDGIDVVAVRHDRSGGRR